MTFISVATAIGCSPVSPNRDDEPHIISITPASPLAGSEVDDGWQEVLNNMIAISKDFESSDHNQAMNACQQVIDKFKLFIRSKEEGWSQEQLDQALED
jgi:hypothetical protein